MLKVCSFHNSILKSCSYCIYDNSSWDCYVMDVGDAEPIKSFIKDNRMNLKGIFLTHPHFDHVYGISELTTEFPTAKIYCSAETLEGLKDEDVNMSYMYLEDEFQIPDDSQFELIESSSEISCFGHSIQIIACPGHDTGCLCYIIGQNIFTGDSYTPFAPVTYNWHRCDKEKALESESRIVEIIKTKGLRVYQGHYQ